MEAQELTGISAITVPSNCWVDQLKTSYSTYFKLQQIIEELRQGKAFAPHYQEEMDYYFTRAN